jgi:DNA-binding LacI/PurR family transcriptional regulator
MWGPPPKGLSFCTVGSDDARGGYLAARHLLELGRRRIAFVGGPLGRPEVKLRYKGYVKALREARLRIEETLIAWGDYSSQSGFEKMSALLNRRPDLDAAFIAGDLMAVGAMQALQAVNRRIPHDVAVVGYDGMPLSEYSSPPLTTVRQNIAAAGNLLVHNLLQYLDNGVVCSDVLPVDLVTRQSTTG